MGTPRSLTTSAIAANESLGSAGNRGRRALSLCVDISTVRPKILAVEGMASVEGGRVLLREFRCSRLALTLRQCDSVRGNPTLEKEVLHDHAYVHRRWLSPHPPLLAHVEGVGGGWLVHVGTRSERRAPVTALDPSGLRDHRAPEGIRILVARHTFIASRQYVFQRSRHARLGPARSPRI